MQLESRNEVREAKTLLRLPEGYYLDESDSDLVVLRRQDGSFVAAFSASGATKEGIREAADEDFWRLLPPTHLEVPLDGRRATLQESRDLSNSFTSRHLGE